MTSSLKIKDNQSTLRRNNHLFESNMIFEVCNNHKQDDKVWKKKPESLIKFSLLPLFQKWLIWIILIFDWKEVEEEEEEEEEGMEIQLLDACQSRKIEEVRKLLQDPQININWQDRYGMAPLWTSCDSGYIDIVKLLLNDERIDVNKTDKYGQTPFFVACRNGHVEVVKLLLNDERVDVIQANEDGQTPFYIACQNGYLEIVKLLLGSGREINLIAKNNKGLTAIDIARKEGKEKIVELIESFQKNPNETRTKLKNEPLGKWLILFTFYFQF